MVELKVKKMKKKKSVGTEDEKRIEEKKVSNI